jgi:3-oxoacyl-[acyl-carrier-protein] synthase III
MAQTLTFRLAGSGAYLPQRRVRSCEVDRLCQRPEGWTEEHFAIRERRWAGPDETTSQMAAMAAQQALGEAGWSADSLDAVIGACGVMEQPIPSTAVLVQRKLGLGDSGIPAFDINATCLSFLVAFERAVLGLAFGQWKRVLVFSSDIASAALDFREAEAAVLFGDGAAAVLLEAGDAHALRGFRFETYGAGSDLCRLGSGGTLLTPRSEPLSFAEGSYFRMDGPGVFRLTARKFPGFLSRLMTQSALDLHELETVIPHQASNAALAHLRKSLGNATCAIIETFREVGNQVATSIPNALHHARTSGQLARGSKSLLVGSSAGISLGGAVIEW